MIRTGPAGARRAVMVWDHGRRRRVHSLSDQSKESFMSKRGRKRRSRKGSAANHGNRPNA